MSNIGLKTEKDIKDALWRASAMHSRPVTVNEVHMEIRSMNPETLSRGLRYMSDDPKRYGVVRMGKGIYSIKKLRYVMGLGRWCD